MKIILTDICIGDRAANRSDDSLAPGYVGAVAALETFYHGFNARRPDVLAAAWAGHPLVQLNNPLGGVLRGHAAIDTLYRRVLAGRAQVWVEFFDVVAYEADAVVVFAGRERGECRVGDEVLPLAIRTSRVFAYSDGGGWKQVHHHGSIDDPDALRSYQRLIGHVSPPSPEAQ